MKIVFWGKFLSGGAYGGNKHCIISVQASFCQANRNLLTLFISQTSGNARLRVSLSVKLSMRRNARLSTRKIAKKWNRKCALMFQRKIAIMSLLRSAVRSPRRCVRGLITRRRVIMSPSRSASRWKRRFVLQLRSSAQS